MWDPKEVIAELQVNPKSVVQISCMTIFGMILIVMAIACLVNGAD